jgi:hypothetical protein
VPSACARSENDLHAASKRKNNRNIYNLYYINWVPYGKSVGKYSGVVSRYRRKSVRSGYGRRMCGTNLNRKKERKKDLLFSQQQHARGIINYGIVRYTNTGWIKIL